MIKHLIMDVDGVLNTGHFIYTEEGKFGKVFGPHDKDGLELIKTLGITIDFVTADKTGFPISKARIIKDWKFREDQLHLVGDGTRLHWVMSQGWDLKEIAFVGDGIHDAPVIRSVGLGIAPCSGRVEARRAARYITPSPAGAGAVLDACLYIEKFNKRLQLLESLKFWR